MRAAAVGLALACAAAGCASDVTGASLVDGLRLLGVHAEPPEAAPGQTVTLTAWVVDTHGGSIDVTWSACLLPNAGKLDPACFDGSDGSVALGSGETISMVVPDVQRDALGPPDATDGVYVPIVVRVRTPDDQVDAVYRLRIAGSLPPNHNPVFDTIEGLPPEDTPQPVKKGQSWTVRARYTGASSERYEIPSSGDTPFEFLTTQWFATALTFHDPISGGAAFDSFVVDGKLPPSGGAIELWAVGHDERGGTAMIHRRLILQ
jgi:hypothetical protein